ncbi:M23 family metallopeptidase [Erythrobacter sp.]|uniref:M23 family metallopeptidase n=1 Tax=Erythrobacter sp. TaxID=1042 RepID=UPI001425E25D|nr:M23 family metallopeptidase [Erythrobacter sp.]QIQ86236.1 MAG: M23 family metallopeptidase [Erythrobacter sp.]
MKFLDRLTTILVTATLTSVLWIVFGGTVIELAENRRGDDSLRPAEAAPSPQAADTSEQAGAGDDEVPVPSLDPPEPTAGADPSEARSDPATLRIPVMNVAASELSDTFADRRGENSVRLHEAIDIMAPEGTSVVAAAPGTVAKLHRSKAGGNAIYVRSPDRRRIYYYAHLAEYAEGLREGQRIRAGQRLGTVGSSGNASPQAPHLHFAILETTEDAAWWEPANAINPYPLLVAGREE